VKKSVAVNLEKLNRWVEGNELVGRIINYLYEYGSMSIDELNP
jgi:hypothetical protein